MNKRILSDDIVRERMQSLRKLAGLTQKEVEKTLGLRDMFVYDFESGRIKLPFSTGAALLDLYNVSLDTAFPLKTTNQKKVMDVSSAAMPMFKMGLLENNLSRLIEFIHQDPVIAGTVGIDNLVSGKTLLRSLVEKLPEYDRRTFVLVLYKCVQSLISCDDSISNTELVLRDIILCYPAMELKPEDVNEIHACTGIHYLPADSDKIFHTEALKHFLVWVLYVMALCDGPIDRREEIYIEKVTEFLGLSKTVYFWFREKVGVPVQKQY